MNNEYLEALERLKENSYYINDKNLQEDYITIKQALQRLEAIDNAEPSEALEDFKIIKFKTINAGYNYGYKVWDKIEQALLKAQEQEKILSIFKEKADVSSLEMANNVNEFNEMTLHNKPYTQEEFELLKRWLDEYNN